MRRIVFGTLAALVIMALGEGAAFATPRPLLEACETSANVFYNQSKISTFDGIYRPTFAALLAICIKEAQSKGITSKAALHPLTLSKKCKAAARAVFAQMPKKPHSGDYVYGKGPRGHASWAPPDGQARYNKAVDVYYNVTLKAFREGALLDAMISCFK